VVVAELVAVAMVVEVVNTGLIVGALVGKKVGFA